MKKQYLEIGKIVNTHGIKGEVKIMPWCDDAEFVTEFDVLYLDKGNKKISVSDAKVHKGMVIAKLEGIDTIEQANAYRNQILYMDREEVELEPGTYFIQDLIGLKVVDANSGMVYGTLTEVFPTGANDVYQVKNEDGKEYLVPAIPQVIEKTDLEAGEMLIVPLEGLFEE